jgi:hydrogenase expression/formation protein HypE
MSDPKMPGEVCASPIAAFDRVVMGHGSGGKLTADLIQAFFLPAFRNPHLSRLDDQAVLEINGTRLAFTTDSFVVSPIFFPGGDIGSLAINGTINDLAMSGARPRFIAAALILEEGLPLDELGRVIESMRRSCAEADVLLVTGDTKVVNRGHGDKIFITTTGLGVLEKPVRISADQARPGDKIIVSGLVGDHGMAVMSQREHLEFEGAIQSDTAPLHTLVEAILTASAAIHCLRDPTRGGVATTLHELATASHVGIEVDERKIPVQESVKGACEILGLDPLYVANEGKLIAIVAHDAAEAVLHKMREHPLGREAQIIGEVVSGHPGRVLAKTGIGGTRLLDVMYGEPLPRIC